MRFVDRACAAAAELGDRQPVDVLHHEPGHAIIQGGRIIDASDQRMVQLGKHLLLVRSVDAERGKASRCSGS